MNKYMFLNSLKSAMKRKGHTQLDVAKSTGIHQSQISKILNRRFSREDADTIDRLKEYSNYNEYLKQHQLTGKIDKAVSEIWDGSSQMEQRIANIIRRLGPELMLLDCAENNRGRPKLPPNQAETN